MTCALLSDSGLGTRPRKASWGAGAGARRRSNPVGSIASARARLAGRGWQTGSICRTRPRLYTLRLNLCFPYPAGRGIYQGQLDPSGSARGDSGASSAALALVLGAELLTSLPRQPSRAPQDAAPA